MDIEDILTEEQYRQECGVGGGGEGEQSLQARAPTSVYSVYNTFPHSSPLLGLELQTKIKEEAAPLAEPPGGPGDCSAGQEFSTEYSTEFSFGLGGFRGGWDEPAGPAAPPAAVKQTVIAVPSVREDRVGSNSTTPAVRDEKYWERRR